MVYKPHLSTAERKAIPLRSGPIRVTAQESSKLTTSVSVHPRMISTQSFTVTSVADQAFKCSSQDLLGLIDTVQLVIIIKKKK